MAKRSAAIINILFILLIAFGISALGYSFFNKKSFVPENFVEARAKSSAVASELVSILEGSVKNLEKIAEEDRSGKFEAALKLVDQENDGIEKATAQALKLSSYLNTMAQAVEGIRPASAKNLALEAVTQEVTMMNHLLTYNAHFRSLLATLKLKFLGDVRYDSGDVQSLINSMNKEAADINSINDSFNQKLQEFDEALK